MPLHCEKHMLLVLLAMWDANVQVTLFRLVMCRQDGSLSGRLE